MSAAPFVPAGGGLAVGGGVAAGEGRLGAGLAHERLVEALLAEVGVQPAVAEAGGAGRSPSAGLTRRRQRVLYTLDRLAGTGEEVFHASGVGGLDDTEQLRRRAAELEQTVLELRPQLQERTQELDAARATNRDLMAALEPIAAHRDRVGYAGSGRSLTTCFITNVEVSRCTPGRAARVSSSSCW
jgi:hypothetical protein